MEAKAGQKPLTSAKEPYIEVARKYTGNTPTTLVLVFFLSFFLLSASGRLASYDAGNQLQAAILLANTGSLGTRSPPADHSLWVMNRTGTYYECHDIGNAILMFPAAYIASLSSHGPLAGEIENPPIIAKVVVSLTYSVLSAIACLFMFRLFNLYYTGRTAFLLSLAFVTTTIFWPYTKSAYDVLGAACFVCPALYFSAKIASGEKHLRNVLWAGAFAAIACSFRLSFAPFLVLAMTIILFYARHTLRIRHWLVCALAYTIGLTPTLIYNYVRMGSILRPATSADVWVVKGTADLSGNIFSGLFGLLLSPNTGLLFFSPIFVLLLLLPFIWRRVSLSQRQLCIAFGTGTLLYILFISKLREWAGDIGWGPRYLVPVVPILFFLTAITLTTLWERYRSLFLALIGVSVALSTSPVLVNWSLAISEFPQTELHDPYLPYQYISVWNGLVLALHGRELPVPRTDVATRSGVARFPDLWTVRLMEQSHLGFIMGLTISLLLLAVSIWAFRRLTRVKLQGAFKEF